MRFALILALTLTVPFAAYAGTRIVDGDTLDVAGIRYRLNGIDAPEAGQRCDAPSGNWPCGKAAISKLAELAEDKALRCVARSEDGYGRVIATCYDGDVDIGAEMVRSGFAWAFVKYSEAYVTHEAEARSAGSGIWRGDAVPAWEYRASRWSEAERSAPEGCPIKGNISRNGRIYHPPWSPWYSRTRINEAKGERWFCSEADAVAAGWRAPRWR